MKTDPPSLVGKLVSGCFSLLLAAAALYLAVKLVEAVWVVLVIMLLVVLAIGGLVLLVRTRISPRGW